MDPAAFNARCSIARSLEVLGEKWTLLILREAFRDVTRFSAFRENLGVARDVLADRLGTLVEAGVMSKRAYRDDNARERDEYVLTGAGLALRPVLAAITEWGDEYRATEAGPTARFVKAGTSHPVHIAFVDETGRIVPSADVVSEFTPAAYA
jgi:DNA-binding HxlR family transcriptional regulator